MSRVMLIGAGGVAGVAAAKMAQNPETFGELLIASRTEARCKAIKADIEARPWYAAKGTATKITTAQIDAMDVPRLTALIQEYKPDLVMNIALPYQDLAIMDACLAAGVSYLDTANYEPPEEAHFEYSWQWAYRERFEKAGLTAILGCGFDPGVTQVFSAYAQKHYFDEIHTLDILDCNGGDHGYPFATNFNPEINIREVSAKGSYWVADPAADKPEVAVENKKAFDKGWWVETAPMAIKRVYNFDQVGEKDMYLLHHEELESLGCNLKGIKRIRFFMTFGQSYLTHLKCLENVGMTRIDPIDFKGQKIVPIEFLKALLPDPATLGRQAGALLRVQRVRPPGVLRRGRLAGDQLHDGRTRDDRREVFPRGQVDREGRPHVRGVRPRSVHGRAERAGPPLEGVLRPRDGAVVTAGGVRRCRRSSPA